MAEWHHRCNGHELGQTSGDDEGQRGLARCSHGVKTNQTQSGQLNNNSSILSVQSSTWHIQSSVIICLYE